MALVWLFTFAITLMINPIRYYNNFVYGKMRAML